MRTAIWILDPAASPGEADAIVASLRERETEADVRDLPGGRSVVVRRPPDDLAPPAAVVRVVVADLPTDRDLTRRAFLDAFAVAVAAGAVAGACGLAGAFAAPPARRSGEEGEIVAGTRRELEERGEIRFRFGRDPCIAILSGGQVFALSLVCTHMGCLVEYVPERRQLACPCHRASFDLEGHVLEGPPPRPLPSFDAVIDGDRVLVRRRGRA